jgi:outer membrane immunogenic protein
VPWLATARLRIGSAHDRIQYYATGGVAFARLTADPGNGMEVSSTRSGWTLGVGQESAIQNVLLRFEVLYVQFLGTTETPPGAPVPVSVGRVSDIIARASLSYKFGWPGN